MNRTPLESAVFNDGRKRRDIAAASRISASHLSQILSGRRQPKISVALRLAAALNADVAELFNAGR
jgi:transcriptional regulator with XRE-family HTH domain